jgi:hypothetical protein
MPRKGLRNRCSRTARRTLMKFSYNLGESYKPACTRCSNKNMRHRFPECCRVLGQFRACCSDYKWPDGAIGYQFPTVIELESSSSSSDDDDEDDKDMKPVIQQQQQQQQDTSRAIEGPGAAADYLILVEWVRTKLSCSLRSAPALPSCMECV